jgi:SAM-dependent methyltransferase
MPHSKPYSRSSPRPSPRLSRQIAASVDATPDLLPVLPQLFQGIESLGSSPRRIVNLLRSASIPRQPRILDLACGKGSASIAIAAAISAHVTGIDAAPDFIAHATTRAHRRGLHNQTSFLIGDVTSVTRICNTLGPRTRFDAAIMIGLLGFDHAAPLLRTFLTPGGLYIIDDAVHPSTNPGKTTTPTRGDARDYFASLGDKLLREVMLPRRAIENQNRTILKRLTRNAEALMQDHKPLRRSLKSFISRQNNNSARLLEDLRPTLWLVKKSIRDSDAKTRKITI